jgi:cell division protein FtsZ
MIMPGLINLDFADIRTVMSEMGKAMMGTGEAEGEKRALDAAEAAINNPLLEDISMKGARGVLINITGGMDMTLFEVDEAANRIRDEVDPDANIIFGSTFDDKLEGKMRVSVVATGIEAASQTQPRPTLISLVDQKRPQTPLPAVKAATSLAERIANTSSIFHTAAQTDPEEEIAAALTQTAEPQGQSDAQVAVAAEPMVAQRTGSQPIIRTEPTLSIRSEPAQGSLHIETPAPRVEARPAASYAVASQRPAPEPAAETPHRRSSFLNRLAGHVKPAAHQPAPQPPQPAARTPGSDTLADRAQTTGQTTRISPADRLQTSRSDEDLLEIPAFLRRQAN